MKPEEVREAAKSGEICLELGHQWLEHSSCVVYLSMPPQQAPKERECSVCGAKQIWREPTGGKWCDNGPKVRLV